MATIKHYNTKTPPTAQSPEGLYYVLRGDNENRIDTYIVSNGKVKKQENSEEKIAQLAGATDEKITKLSGETDKNSTEIKTIKENMSSLSIACFYNSILDMEADNSPVNQNTGQTLSIGELAAISNSENENDPDNGKIFAWTGAGWRYMGQLESIASMQFTDNYFEIV